MNNIDEKNESMQELAKRILQEAEQRDIHRREDGNMDAQEAAEARLNRAEQKAIGVLKIAEKKAQDTLNVAKVRAEDLAQEAQREADSSNNVTVAVAVPGEPEERVKVMRISEEQVVIQTDAVEVQFKVK